MHLTFSYNFALGPLDISVMYCDQTRKVQAYINLGIPFLKEHLNSLLRCTLEDFS